MQLFCTHLCTLVTSDNLTGIIRWGQIQRVRRLIQCPLPWQSDAPGSGPGAGFGICCTVGQRATLLEPHGSAQGGSTCAGHSKISKGPLCVNRHSLPVVTIRPYGTATPWGVNRAPTSSLSTSSCSGVAVSLLPPCAVLCPVAVILAVHTLVQMEVPYSH